MKNLKSYLVAVCLIFTFSCTDNEVETALSIVGNWKFISATEVCNNGDTTEDVFDSCGQRGRTTFLDNGTVTLVEYDDFTGTCQEDDTDQGTWQISGDTLTIIWNNDTDVLTIFELSNTTLRVGYTEEDSSPCGGTAGESVYYIKLTRV